MGAVSRINAYDATTASVVPYLAGYGVELFFPAFRQGLVRPHRHGGLALRTVAFHGPRSNCKPCYSVLYSERKNERVFVALIRHQVHAYYLYVLHRKLIELGRNGTRCVVRALSYPSSFLQAVMYVQTSWRPVL